jgi:DNA repair exonuclease SbcCD ATPase subunit
VKWAPTRNSPPASARLLGENLAKAEAETNALATEQEEIRSALADLVAEPERFVQAQARLRDIEALLPAKLRTVEAIRNAIPVAEDRERRDRIEAEIEEGAAKSAKLQRGLEARYTKAAEAFAEVCREIQADSDRLRSARLTADTVKPRLPVTYRSAEMALRYDKFAGSNGLKSLTEGVIVRAWDGGTLFQA